jgi:hypothetical protein
MGGVGSCHPTCGWVSAGPEGLWARGAGWVSQQAVGPVPGWGPVQTGGVEPSGCGFGGMAKGRYPGMVWLAWMGDGYPAVCGSGTDL